MCFVDAKNCYRSGIWLVTIFITNETREVCPNIKKKSRLIKVQLYFISWWMHNLHMNQLAF